MRLLLDTHVVLWRLAGTHRLGERAEAEISAAEELRMSVVSYAEIGIKTATGKLTVPADVRREIHAAGVRTLGLEPEDGLAVAKLPIHHRDPFDRLLVAQALRSHLTLVSADERLRAYDVDILDPLS